MKAAAGQVGTVYLLHFDRPYRHAGHYVGNPGSSRFLNGGGALWGGKFPELTGCSAGGHTFSAAAGPVPKVQLIKRAPDAELVDAYGSAADRETCAFEDIQYLCRAWGADSQDVVNVPGVYALVFRRADHEINGLPAPCQWMYCRDHLVHGVQEQQRPYELHAFLRDCPGPEHGPEDAASGHLKTVGPDHQLGNWHPARFPEIGPVPALQAPCIRGERIHDPCSLISEPPDLPRPSSRRCGAAQRTVLGAVEGSSGGADPEQEGEPDQAVAAGVGLAEETAGLPQGTGHYHLAHAPSAIGSGITKKSHDDRTHCWIADTRSGFSQRCPALPPRHLSCINARPGTTPTETNYRQIQQWTDDLTARLARHARGDGARLLAVAYAAGVRWQLARTGTGTRARERQLKRCGGASRHCPMCGIKPRGGTR